MQAAGGYGAQFVGQPLEHGTNTLAVVLSPAEANTAATSGAESAALNILNSSKYPWKKLLFLGLLASVPVVERTDTV